VTFDQQERIAIIEEGGRVAVLPPKGHDLLFGGTGVRPGDVVAGRKCYPSSGSCGHEDLTVKDVRSEK
jgi:hypothetical protein